MKPADWQRVRALFEQWCELPAAERPAHIAASGLDEASRILLDSMLAADAGPALREDVLAQAPAVLATLAADERLGSRVGAWRIDSLLGTGGMGRVYRAHREDGRFEGVAAVKFVAEAAHPDFFLHERQVLARLIHPGIARLLDAGEDDAGRPYLVMEYIAGRAIDSHCEALRLNACERIRLVIAAAQAIAHAHAQWVLHRDLKPANLMVDSAGQIKVLDFGVAKLLDRPSADPAQTSARYYTLRYAAPEQIAAEGTGIGVDLYALAVILYELLTAAHPCDALTGDTPSLAESVLAGRSVPLRRRLARIDAQRARDLGSTRARDLEAVLDKALARRPEARYGSVREFADELQRVLDDRPVLARATGAMALLWRLARRHRVTVAMGGLALIGLIALAVVALWQARVAAGERDLARRETARAEGIAAFLTSLFETAQPARNQGRNVSARELLDRGRERLSADALDPDQRNAVRVAIADSYRALGAYAEAEALLQETLNSVPADDRRIPRWLLQLARVHNFQSRWSEAERVLRQALQHPGADALLRAALQRQLAVSLLNQERTADAEIAARSALTLLRANARAETRDIVDAEMLLATMAYSRNDLAAAHAAYASIVQALRAGSSSDQGGLMTALNNLAAIELRLDRIDEAIAHYEESIAQARARFGASHREVALPLLGLGSALRAAGRLDSAHDALSESVSIYRQWSGASHPETAYASLLLAELQWLQGETAQARSHADGVAEALAAEHAGSAKSCRADLLSLALLPAEATPSASQLAAIPCLMASNSAPGLVLMARWVAWQRGLAPDEDLAALRQAASTLHPRDAALAQAIAAAPQR